MNNYTYTKQTNLVSEIVKILVCDVINVRGILGVPRIPYNNKKFESDEAATY